MHLNVSSAKWWPNLLFSCDKISTNCDVILTIITGKRHRYRHSINFSFSNYKLWFCVGVTIDRLWWNTKTSKEVTHFSSSITKYGNAFKLLGKPLYGYCKNKQAKWKRIQTPRLLLTRISYNVAKERSYYSLNKSFNMCLTQRARQNGLSVMKCNSADIRVYWLIYIFSNP